MMTKQSTSEFPTRGAFYRALYPDGPWVVCAKHPDGSGMPARGFEKGQEGQMDRWIEQQIIDQKNPYLHVGVPKEAVNRRLNKKDIAGTRCIHADIDAPDGAVPPAIGKEPTTEAEKKWHRWHTSTLDILDDDEQMKLLGFPGVPTAVVPSGAGVHAYWGLRELATDFEAVEARNEQALIALGEPDLSTKNVSRILSIPGRINYPDAKKREAGRAERPVTVHAWRLHLVYDLMEFPTPDDSVRKDGSGSGPSSSPSSGKKVNRSKFKIGPPITTDQEGLLRLRENYPDVHDSIWVAVAQGKDADHPLERDDTGSAWDFHVAMQLVRAEIEPEVILGLYLDDDWGIGSHVTNKAKNGSKPEAYAKKFIIDAIVTLEEERQNEAVEGKAKNQFTGKADIDRYVLLNGQFYDLKTNEIIAPEQLYYATFNWPMRDGDNQPIFDAVSRRVWILQRIPHVDTKVFAPGRPKILKNEAGLRVLNNYANPARPDGDPDDVQWFLDHLFKLFPGERSEVFLDWMALKLQKPHLKIGWAPYVVGPMGCGKDTLIWPLLQHLESYAARKIHFADFYKEHNMGWAYEKLVAVVQENVHGRDGSPYKSYELMKDWVSTMPDKISIRGMRKDVFYVDDHLDFIALTNVGRSLAIPQSCRRFYPMVTEVFDGIQPDESADYFTPLWAKLKDQDGWKNVVCMLLDREATRVVPGGRPPASPDMPRIVDENLPKGHETVMRFLLGDGSTARPSIIWTTVAEVKSKVPDMHQPGVLACLAAAGFVKHVGPNTYGQWHTQRNGRSSPKVKHTVYCRRGAAMPNQDRDMKDLLKNLGEYHVEQHRAFRGDEQLSLIIEQ